MMNKPLHNLPAIFLCCRLQKKLTQRAMAKRLRLNQSSVCRIEKGVIHPRKPLIRRLERFMELSLKDILPDALKMKSLLTDTLNACRNIKNPDGNISYEHLSENDLYYLKAKWNTLITEAEQTLNRKSYRLKKLTEQTLTGRATCRYLDQQLAQMEKLIAYLTQSKEGSRLLPALLPYRSAIELVRQHFVHERISPVELFLRKTALEELAVIRQYRAGKLQQLIKMTARTAI